MIMDHGRLQESVSAKLSRISIASLKGRNNEGILTLVIAGILILMFLIAPEQVSLTFFGDIIRSGIVTMSLALGLLLVIISGGMDVSFTAIAVFSGYCVVLFMQRLGIDGAVWPFFAAAAIGACLGVLNAVLVAKYQMETLVATLGTQVVIRGVLLAFIGSTYLATLPPRLDSVGQLSLFKLGNSPVNVTVLVVLGCALLIAWVLSKTTFGRSIYAVGGSKEASRRVGINVKRVQVGIYVIAGLLAGLGGMVHVALSRHASPFELVGTEMTVIAAVVIGGALDSGGRGSVKGTVLGVLLISLTQNSLVRLGVSSYWQTLVVGFVILMGVVVQAKSTVLSIRRPQILEEVGEK